MLPPGCFYGWGLFFVYIDMSANLQPIPLGLLAIKPFVELTITTPLSENESGESIYQSDFFTNPPSVFIDGLLITYNEIEDRRYVTFDDITKTITFKNGVLNYGEILQIFL